MGIVKDIDSRVVFNAESLHKIARHKSRQSCRKANKALKQDTTLADFGKYYMVKTNVSLAPFNTRSGTNYMLPANTECIAVNMIGWVALYLTNGLVYDSIEDVKERCKHIRAHESDFRRTNSPVIFRDAAKVAFKKMLPDNWINDADAYVPRIVSVYGK